MKKNKERMKRCKVNVVFYITVMFFVIFVVSVVMFVTQTVKANREQKAFERLAEMEVQDNTIKDNSVDEGSETTDEKSRFDTLSELNGDYAGWLTIPNTDIDYPVMYTPSDTEYYINRAFDKSESKSGTPFIGAGGNVNSDCFIIYAHNMKNKTMFGTLDKYSDKSFWNSNKTFTLETDNGIVKYEVFAAVKTRILRTDETGFRYYNASGELSEEKYTELVDWLRTNSIYDTEIIPSYDEQILILSTCSYQTENGRFIVAARKI